MNLSLDLQRNIEIPTGIIKDEKQQINPCDFYLYYDLQRQAQNKCSKFSKQDMKELIGYLQRIDVEGGRIIFILLRMYALQNKQGKMFDVPFQGKIIKETQGMCDIEFDAKLLPDTLQFMILLFCKKHTEQQQIEGERMMTFV